MMIFARYFPTMFSKILLCYCQTIRLSLQTKLLYGFGQQGVTLRLPE